MRSFARRPGGGVAKHSRTSWFSHPLWGPPLPTARRAQVQTAFESGPGVLDTFSRERTEGQPRRVPASGAQARAALAGERGRRRGRCPGEAPRRTARLSLGQASGSCVSLQDSWALRWFSAFTVGIFPLQLNLMFIRFASLVFWHCSSRVNPKWRNCSFCV